MENSFLFNTARWYVLLCILIIPELRANENGWDLILKNDNKGARIAFTEVLSMDSTRLDALQGMIYLSEIEQDNLSYHKYINIAIRNHWDEHFYLLFRNSYSGSADEVLKQSGFSERSKFILKMNKADELITKRQFDAAEKAFRALVTNYQWSLIGPFKNTSGSGHIVQHPIEKESFSNNKIYKNERGLELKWIKPAFSDNTGKVNFDGLPDNFSGGVYFANTFIEVPESGTIQLRIGRSSPIKIWLDDHLVFDNNEEINFEWDNEILELSVNKGIHRILVKTSPSGSAPRSYDFLSFSDNSNNHLSYSNYSSYFSSYNFSSLYGSSHGGDNSFALRITDQKGNNLSKITPAAGNVYSVSTYNTIKSEQPLIAYYHRQVEANPDDLFSYYALNKAYLDAGLSRKAEEFFVKKLRAQKNHVMLKYLVAKLYAQNGKIEKAYEILNDIDQTKTPIFGLLYDKLKDIDVDNDEQKYLEALNKLKSVTPSNYSVISGYLKYYDKKGLQKEKEEFIKEMKKTYPDYESTLDFELSSDLDKPYKGQTDKEREKAIRSSIKNIKSHFFIGDYITAIEHYKGKDKFGKVIALYDELIRYMPYSAYYRKEKAEYLFSEEKYEPALKELEEVLKIAPYDGEAMEQMGDLYNYLAKEKKENQQKALEFYTLAKKYNKDSYGIDKKIEKIQGQKTQKTLFSTKSFEDVLKDNSWQNLYNDEESLILLFTSDMVYDSSANVNLYQQMMIKILNESGAKKWTEYNFDFLGMINSIKVIKSTGAEVVPDKMGGHVVFKNLEPGDLIQIDGVYEWEQFSELDQELAQLHYATFDAPIYYKKLEVAVPKGRYLGYQLHKLKDNLVKSTKGDYDFYLWEYTNLPKVENEDALLDYYDPYGSIMVSTMRDWSKVVEWYQQTTYRKLEMTYETKEALDSIVKPGMSAEEKVVAIYNYLTKQIKYSYVPFLQSGYVPKDLGLTMCSRIGDCKDGATLMISMLREVGIESYYTLVKTNMFNHQDMLPSLYFDHVVVCYFINGAPHYLDMTTDFYPHYVLTENDVNAWALLIKDGEKNIFRLPNDDLDSIKNKVIYEVEALLNPDRSMSIKASSVYPGMEGGSTREFLASASKQEQQNFVIDKLGKSVFQDIDLIDHQFQNLDDILNPLTANYELKAPDFADEVVDLLICRIPYMTAIQPHAAISSKIRHNRLNVEALGSIEPTLQKINISFPKGYQLIKLPKDIDYSGKYGTYKVKFKKTANGLYVEKYQAFYTKVIEESEFAAFRDFYLKLLYLDKTKIAIQHKS